MLQATLRRSWRKAIRSQRQGSFPTYAVRIVSPLVEECRGLASSPSPSWEYDVNDSYDSDDFTPVFLPTNPAHYGVTPHRHELVLSSLPECNEVDEKEEEDYMLNNSLSSKLGSNGSSYSTLAEEYVEEYVADEFDQEKTIEQKKLDVVQPQSLIPSHDSSSESLNVDFSDDETLLDSAEDDNGTTNRSSSSTKQSTNGTTLIDEKDEVEQHSLLPERETLSSRSTSTSHSEHTVVYNSIIKQLHLRYTRKNYTTLYTNDISSLFRRSVELDIRFTPQQYMQLLTLFTQQRDLTSTLEVLMRYIHVQKHASQDSLNSLEMDVEPRAFRIACDAVGEASQQHQNSEESVLAGKYLFDQLKMLDVEQYQKVCLPRLLLSLSKCHYHQLRNTRDNAMPPHNEQHQANNELGPLAAICQLSGSVLGHMRRMDFPIDANAYNGALLYEAHSTNHRSGESSCFPAPYMMNEMTRAGFHPSSDIVIRILMNEAPYTSMTRLVNILQSIVQILSAKRTQQNNSNGNVNLAADYRVNIGTLETICGSCGRSGSSKGILLVWDLVDLLGFVPTKGMYEGAVLAFLNERDGGPGGQDETAFSILAEMEWRGLSPSRSFISAVARRLRISQDRIDNSYFLLASGTEGSKITAASLNCILKACAMHGLIDRAYALVEDMEQHEVQPNSDSYSYLMEALLVQVMNLIRNADTHVKVGTEASTEPDVNADDITRLVELADTTLQMMDQCDIVVSRHVIDNYIRILTYSGRVNVAISFLTEQQDMTNCIEQGKSKVWSLPAEQRRRLLKKGTYIQMAKQCSFRQDFDKSRFICNLMKKEGMLVPKDLIGRINFHDDKQKQQGST